MTSAYDIADALGRPRPTTQQVRVIEAPLEPALVVAGAGSGKTETMANRVLWLLANGHVEPSQVLGLTFTRKAAGELSQRIRERIAQLGAAGLLAAGHDGFDPPTVATYNSFANTLYRDNAVLLGRESDGSVLGEASAWQLMRSVVVGSDDERLPLLGRSVDAITKAALQFAHALGDNIADPGAVEAMAQSFARLADLPPGGSGAYADVDTLAATVGALPVLVGLAERYDEAKRLRGFVEYSDQVALALELVRRTPTIVEEYRDRHRVVLLDEYQDTSVVQSWLLAELFGGTPVMAVGDPNQSIYGWRGASAANLEQFPERFAATATFALSTSWRNGRRILDVANAVVEPFTHGARVPVERLTPGPTASDLPVDVHVLETVEEEAAFAAAWLRERVGSGDSAAMLFRTRATQRWFVRALRDAGVPYHVLGIGGLMAEPEVADLVAALTVVHDPTAGAELVRLLAGSRWRLGVRDLQALRGVASWLRDRDHTHRQLDEEVRKALRASVAEGEGGSLVDALDFVATVREGHVALERFSPVGLARLRDAGQRMARLRARAGLELLDFATFVEQELLLDVEVAANETRPAGGAAMEAFRDALTGYLGVAAGEGSDRATLGGFLSWLREAEWRDNLAPRPEEPEPGTVQLLTIHGSKGLEWDHVVVPRLAEGELPGTPAEGSTGWLGFGQLPWEFRGDAAELPVFAWRGAATRKQLLAARDEFKTAVRARNLAEERRLAYVAVTRARHSLLLTTSFWATQVKPRTPSIFLRELAEAGVVAPLREAPENETNPLDLEAEPLTWPFDPLGGRRAAVERAAERVRAARPGAGGRWDRDLDLLLEERRRRMAGQEWVPVPTRVPASRFKDFVESPAEVAAALRRPMPVRPHRATRLGTIFHSWVEERFGLAGATEVVDALDGELDELDGAVDAEQLSALQAAFERSEWATRVPVEVEREIHLPLDGQVVVCKIDAVYALPDGRYEVVDWKTGAAPTSPADLERRQLQLALYRLAYARWKGIDPALVDAAFFFVASEQEVRPERLHDERELVALWRASLGA